MKILFAYPWLKLGGAPMDAISLAKGFRDRGHDVYFFTKPGGEHQEMLDNTGIPIIAAPYSRWNPLLYNLNYRAYKILCQTIDRYDIDVIFSLHHTSYVLSLFATLSRDVPVVHTLVWLTFNIYYPAYPGRVVFVAEEFLHQSKPCFRLEPRERYVIPNRVDLDMFHPRIEAGDFPRKYRLPDSRIKIAFMSRINHAKFNSLLSAMEAAAILADRGMDVCLAIAGGGPYYDNLAKNSERINRKVGKEIVKLLGVVIDTSRVLAWSDIVFGIGRCAWEGMASGKPTLVVGEMGFAGTVSPENVKELGYYNFAGRNLNCIVSPEVLADEVVSIINDEILYEELAKFAREYAEKEYDYREGVIKLEEVFRQSINDPPLTGAQKLRLLFSNMVFGYGYQAYRGIRMILRNLIRGK